MSSIVPPSPFKEAFLGLLLPEVHSRLLKSLICIFFCSDSGFLSCSFDDGLCGWIRDSDGDVHWETTPDPSGNWRNLFVSGLLGGEKAALLMLHKCKHTYVYTHRHRALVLNYRSR